MKNMLLGFSLFAVSMVTNSLAAGMVSDEASLKTAIAKANADSSLTTIVFEKDAKISLTSPVIYTGKQSLTLQGNGAVIDGAKAGRFVLDKKLLAYTKDASLVFKTAADISINKLSVVNSATRGIAVKIPDTAEGKAIKVSLHQVSILNSALYGLHIDDNADEFDDGTHGSAIGITLNISHSSIMGNGTGAIDFDGIRVDERGQGSIQATIISTHIDENGGDGLELDEAGAGHVTAILKHVSLNDNGFYNKDDLDDGFDIDERGAGNIEASLFKVLVNGNKDEGLDFDESGKGNVKVRLQHVIVMDTKDEGIKIDEQGVGNLHADLSDVMVMNGTDDGIQITEVGKGRIKAVLLKVTATDNKKYGVQIGQWLEKDEKQSVENAGTVKVEQLTLSGNGNGDELRLYNVSVEHISPKQ